VSWRLKILRGRYAQARADVDACDAEIRRVSAARLAALLKLADRSALIAALRDPVLIPFDRQQLEHAIVDLLPPRRIRIPRTVVDTMRSGLRHARYHWRSLVLLFLISIPVSAMGGIAARNTGHAKVYLNNALDITWTFADGHTEVHRQPVDTAVLVMGRNPNGDVRLRFWSATEGHGESFMSAETYGRFVRSTSE
jgi:hypothetical protein